MLLGLLSVGREGGRGGLLGGYEVGREFVGGGGWVDMGRVVDGSCRIVRIIFGDTSDGTSAYMELNVFQ